MSIDTVDELHSADDQATTYLTALRRLVEACHEAVIDPEAFEDEADYRIARDRYAVVLGDVTAIAGVDYCRCFCTEIAEVWGDDSVDDCCGCPCHDEEE